MEAKEDFLIPNFYSLTDEDKAAIQNAKSQPPKADDWENGGLSGFKRRFKKSLKRLQNSHCAYCRTKVWDANNFFAIEHIVHKSDHPEWMFLPENLCLSCSRCNSHKGTKNVLVKVGATTYPNASTDFLIVNPYYDKYSDHIELVDGILYKGLTPKGRKTIQICKLSRYQLASYRAQINIANHPGQGMGARILRNIIMNPTLVDDLKDLIEEINDCIQEYKANLRP